MKLDEGGKQHPANFSDQPVHEIDSASPAWGRYWNDKLRSFVVEFPEVDGFCESSSLTFVVLQCSVAQCLSPLFGVVADCQLLSLDCDEAGLQGGINDENGRADYKLGGARAVFAEMYEILHAAGMILIQDNSVPATVTHNYRTDILLTGEIHYMLLQYHNRTAVGGRPLLERIPPQMAQSWWNFARVNVPPLKLPGGSTASKTIPKRSSSSPKKSSNSKDPLADRIAKATGKAGKVNRDREPNLILGLPVTLTTTRMAQAQPKLTGSKPHGTLDAKHKDVSMAAATVGVAVNGPGAAVNGQVRGSYGRGVVTRQPPKRAPKTAKETSMVKQVVDTIKNDLNGKADPLVSAKQSRATQAQSKANKRQSIGKVIEDTNIISKMVVDPKVPLAQPFAPKPELDPYLADNATDATPGLHS